MSGNRRVAQYSVALEVSRNRFFAAPIDRETVILGISVTRDFVAIFAEEIVPTTQLSGPSLCVEMQWIRHFQLVVAGDYIYPKMVFRAMVSSGQYFLYEHVRDTP